MSKTLEYMVRTSTTYVVTRYTKDEQHASGSVVTICTSHSAAEADAIAASVALTSGGVHIPMADEGSQTEYHLLSKWHEDWQKIIRSKKYAKWLGHQNQETKDLATSMVFEDAAHLLTLYKFSTAQRI